MLPTWPAAAVRRASWLVVVAACGGALAACGGSPRRPANLLLISIDTLRSDHLGAYGYARATSPRIDALAREGVLFRNTYAPVPRTTQSVASILTGLYPKHHGARGLFSYLAPGNETLAEILKERGYRTWAIVSNLFLQPGKGFEQGFDSYSNPPNRFDGDSAREITDEALARLRSLPDAPFFLWVHYLEPHWTYAPRAEFARRFDPDYVPSEKMKQLDAGKFRKGEIIFQNPLSPEDRRHLIALYDGEIAQVDAEIGRLVDGIRPETRKDLLLVLTSDHGESLGEHGYCFAHGEYLYDGTLRVPLLFLFPGRLRGGEAVGRTVSLLDVAPSILRLLGMPDRVGMDGVPLFSSVRDGRFTPSGGHDLLFAETDYQLIHSTNPRFLLPGVRGRWAGARRGLRKLIRIPRPEGSLQEFYDLRSDPGEERDLETQGSAEAEELARDLDGWIDFQEGTGPNLQDLVSPEQRDNLRTLGYLQ